MRKYPITLKDGRVVMVSKIGANHSADGVIYDEYASSYANKFDNNDVVCIENGEKYIRYCTIGDIKEAYAILREEIWSKNPNNLLEYAECVQSTIIRYFGNFYKTEHRFKFFPNEKDVLKGKKRGCISDLAHQNAAMCVERAMLSQNLLLEIGIDSTFKASGIIINGQSGFHAYNLIHHDGEYYIFDSTIPSINNGRINPIICKIPEDAYELMVNPGSEFGYSVESTHINPLQNKEYNIIYDAGRENIKKRDKQLIK